MFVSIQLYARRTEMAQPLLKGLTGLAYGHAPGHRSGSITFCAIGQEASGPGA